MRLSSFVPSAGGALLAAVVLALAPSTAVAAPDAVARAIASAQSSRAITPAVAARLRATWNASTIASRRAPTAQRRREIGAVRTYALRLASRGQLTAGRLDPMLESVKATTYVMGSSRVAFPRHEQVITIPGDPLVFKYYSGRGVQYQPFETFKLGEQLVNVPLTPPVAKARALADRMRELAVPRAGHSLVWEYYFPFYGPSTPWTSSLSQAVGAEFFHRVSQLVAGPDAPTDADPAADAYEQVAMSVARSFLVSTRAGGVSVPQGSGRWYTIYSFNPSQRILNGHLQVLISLQRIVEDTHSPALAGIVARGVNAVLPMLPQFDTGAWSRYQLGQEADLNYHDYMTTELRYLSLFTTLPGHATFHDYWVKFRRYRRVPPTVQLPTAPLDAIVGAGDGFRDTVSLRYSVDKRSSDRLSITDENGTVVRTLSTGGGTGTHVITWDGRKTDGHSASSGTYTALLTSTDVAGNSVTQAAGPFTVERDTEPPAIASWSVRAAGAASSKVVVTATDVGSGYIDARVTVPGATVARRLPRTGTTTIIVPKSVTVVRRGVLRLRDTSGNELVQPLA